MSSRRMIRVSEVMRAELSRLISRERGFETALLTITSVEVTSDLRQAHIYYTYLNEQIPQKELQSMLDAHRQEWQPQVGQRIKTKFTPRLHFYLDESQQRGDRVMQILQSIEPVKPPRPDEDEKDLP